MGHIIQHFTFPVKTKRQEIIAECAEYANRNGDYPNQIEGAGIRFKDNTVYSCYEDAEKAIQEMDSGWYDNIAVKYKDVHSIKSAKIDDIRRRINETQEKKVAYSMAHDISTFKSQYIGCKKCGSKLSKDHLHGYYCPLCRNDLRSETTISTLNGYDEKIKSLQKQELEEKKKMRDKAPEMWLVKFEFHC